MYISEESCEKEKEEGGEREEREEREEKEEKEEKEVVPPPEPARGEKLFLED